MGRRGKRGTQATQAPIAGVKLNVVAFVRLHEAGGVYYADADDGAVWSFRRDGDDWIADNAAALPEGAATVSPEMWEGVGLSLSVNLDETEDAEPAPLSPPEPPPFEIAPKRSGYRRVGGTVPFVVVPCDLIVPVIRLRSASGGAAVKYERVDVSSEEIPVEGTNDKTEIVVKQTKRTIEAVDEFKAMDALRARNRNRLKAECADTIIGWLSPKDKRESMRKIIVEVRDEIEKTNEGAVFYRVTPGVVIAAIETDADVAAATVTEALRDAMEGLLEAFNSSDVDRMREIVMGLKGFDALVNDEAADKVREAIDEARRIATTIVRETTKKGRAMEEVKAELDTSAIDAARMMLLAREGAIRPPADEEALSEIDGRVVEVAPEAESPAEENTGEARLIEIGPAVDVDLDDDAMATAPEAS